MYRIGCISKDRRRVPISE